MGTARLPLDDIEETLAALATDHGVAVVSTDADFVRFDDVRWIDPLSDA